MTALDDMPGKGLLQSKAMWGSVTAIALAIAQAFHSESDMQLVLSAGGAVAAAIAAVGRIVAKVRITKLW